MIAALLLGGPPAVEGATASAAFQVKLLLLPPFKDTPECGTAAHGSTVAVTCTAPGTNPLTSPRYLLHVYREGDIVQTVDAVTEPGTVTSWRVVHHANRDFLEIVVGW